MAAWNQPGVAWPRTHYPPVRLYAQARVTPVPGAWDVSVGVWMALLADHVEEAKREHLPLCALANYSLAGPKKDQRA